MMKTCNNAFLFIIHAYIVKFTQIEKGIPPN